MNNFYEITYLSELTLQASQKWIWTKVLNVG